MDSAAENGNSAVASTGMIALYAVIGSLAVLLCIVVVVTCIRKEIQKRKRETVNMDMLEVSPRYGSSLNRQRSISLIDINAHPEISTVHRRESVDSIPRLLSLSCEIPRQQIVNLDVEARQYRASTSIQRYMKSVGLVKDQIDVWDETTDEEIEDSPKKGLKYKKTRPRSRSTDSHSKSILVQSISLSDSEDEKSNKLKGKNKIQEEATSDTDDKSVASKVSRSSKVSKVSRTSKKSATTRHRVESDSEEEYSSDSDHKHKKIKHNNNDNANQSPKKKKKRQTKERKPSSRKLLQTSASSGSAENV
mmetsp:Transcript_54/g.57  ORF Transcript_54/g.57 Transcript_54/m.57 type:complete len:306 (-) Transcript_54:32-949(-)